MFHHLYTDYKMLISQGIGELLISQSCQFSTETSQSTSIMLPQDTSQLFHGLVDIHSKEM